MGYRAASCRGFPPTLPILGRWALGGLTCKSLAASRCSEDFASGKQIPSTHAFGPRKPPPSWLTSRCICINPNLANASSISSGRIRPEEIEEAFARLGLMQMQREVSQEGGGFLGPKACVEGICLPDAKSSEHLDAARDLHVNPPKAHLPKIGSVGGKPRQDAARYPIHSLFLSVFPLRLPEPGVTHDYAAIAARRAIATKSVCCDVHQVALKCSMASAPLLLQRIPAPFIRP